MTGNPLLDEIDALSPDAKQSLQQAHQIAAPMTAQMAAPMITPEQHQQAASANEAPPPAMTHPMPSAVPSLGSGVAPQVKAPIGTSAGDTNELSRLKTTGSGISQIQNPGLRTVASIGDTLGSIFAPKLEKGIPGTEEHHNLLVNNAQNAVNADVTNEGKQATTQHEQAVTAGLPEEEEDRHNLTQSTIDKNDKDKAPTLSQLHANAVNKAIQEGRDPSQDPTVQHLANQIIGLQPGQNKEEPAPKTTDIKGPDGKVHTMGFNPKTGKYDVDEGESGFKPTNVNVNAGDAALDRELKQFSTPHQKSIDLANSQLDKIAGARNMINGNAESQALGLPKVLTALVSGQGSGVRITQPELNAIAKARGVTGDVEGFLNSISGKGKLTSTQQRQLTEILDDVKARITQKQQIANEALDRIGNAGSRRDIIQADKDARKKLTDMENQQSGGSNTPTEGQEKRNSHGDTIVFKEGKWQLKP